MLSKVFQDYVITPKQKEARNEGLEKIKEKFNDIHKKTIFISIFVLSMMIAFPFIFSKNIANFFTSILLWGVFLYSLSGIYANRQDIFHFFKVHSLEKFIYQKIYNEVKKEIDTKLQKKSIAENLIFDTLGESKALLSHKISTDIHKISQRFIRNNLIIFSAIVITYVGIRTYLAYHNYHLSIFELMFFLYDS